MKTIFAVAAFFTITSAFALSIETKRMSEPTIQKKSFYTLLTFSLNTMSVAPEIASKYVLMSNGVITSPVIADQCKGFQVGQSALSQGKVSSIILDIQNPLSGEVNCDSEVQKLVDADVIEVTIKTALLGDGSGSDVAPVSFIIHK
jgi:hypothetical protein